MKLRRALGHAAQGVTLRHAARGVTWWLLAAAVVVMTGGAAAAPTLTAAGTVRYVVIMSFDGTRADALRQVMPAGLLSRAAYSWDAQTTLPSSTLPSHASMLTGVGPDVHRVRFNNWISGQAYLALPTVFSVATGAGTTSAAFVAKSKLMFLLRPGSVTHAEYLPFLANDQLAVAREAARYLARMQPHLLFIHVADPDDAGHAAGWMSGPYIAAVRRIPETVGVILDVLRRMYALDDSLVIVTADHGGHGRAHGSDDPQDMTIPWLAFGAVDPGPVRRRIVTYDTAATALAALGIPLPASWQGKPVLQPVGTR